MARNNLNLVWRASALLRKNLTALRVNQHDESMLDSRLIRCCRSLPLLSLPLFFPSYLPPSPLSTSQLRFHLQWHILLKHFPLNLGIVPTLLPTSPNHKESLRPMLLVLVISNDRIFKHKTAVSSLAFEEVLHASFDPLRVPSRNMKVCGIAGRNRIGIPMRVPLPGVNAAVATRAHTVVR